MRTQDPQDIDRRMTITDLANLPTLEFIKKPRGGWVSLDDGQELGGTEDSPPDVAAEWWDELPPLPGSEEIVEGYLLQLGELEADAARADHVLAAAKAHHATRVRRVNSGIARLKHFCLADVQAQARKDIDEQRGKAKSKHYDHGTCGWRRHKKTIITDETAARYWASANCPEAVKRPEPYVLKSKLPKGEEIPGVQWIDEDQFFARGGGK